MIREISSSGTEKTTEYKSTYVTQSRFLAVKPILQTLFDGFEIHWISYHQGVHGIRLEAHGSAKTREGFDR